MREMGQSAWLSTSYLLYRARREESMRGRQEPAVTTGYHGAIIILSAASNRGLGEAPGEIAPSQNHTGVAQRVFLSRLRTNYFGTRKLRGSTCVAQRENTFAGCSKRPSRGP